MPSAAVCERAVSNCFNKWFTEGQRADNTHLHIEPLMLSVSHMRSKIRFRRDSKESYKFTSSYVIVLKL